MSVSGPWGRWWLCPHRPTTQGKSQHKNTIAASTDNGSNRICILMWCLVPSWTSGVAVLVVKVSLAPSVSKGEGVL